MRYYVAYIDEEDNPIVEDFFSRRRAEDRMNYLKKEEGIIDIEVIESEDEAGAVDEEDLEDWIMDQFQTCGLCRRIFHRNDLTWINDLYGIPYKKVCDKCYEEVNEWIRSNDYGKYLTEYEMWGDE